MWQFSSFFKMITTPYWWATSFCADDTIDTYECMIRGGRCTNIGAGKRRSLSRPAFLQTWYCLWSRLGMVTQSGATSAHLFLPESIDTHQDRFGEISHRDNSDTTFSHFQHTRHFPLDTANHSWPLQICINLSFNIIHSHRRAKVYPVLINYCIT